MAEYPNNRQRMIIERRSASISYSNRTGEDGPIAKGRPYYVVYHHFCLGDGCPTNALTVKYYQNCPSMSDLGLNTWGWRIYSKRYLMTNGRSKKSMTKLFNYKWSGNPKDPFVTTKFNSGTWPKASEPNYDTLVNEYRQGMNLINGEINEPSTWGSSKLECGGLTGSKQFNDPCPWEKIRETYLYLPGNPGAQRFDHLVPCDINELPAGYAGKFDDTIDVELKPLRQMTPEGMRPKFLGEELTTNLGINASQSNPSDELNYDARVGQHYVVKKWENDILDNPIVVQERWKCLATYNDTDHETLENRYWRFEVLPNAIGEEDSEREGKEILYYPPNPQVRRTGQKNPDFVPGQTFYTKSGTLPWDYTGGSLTGTGSANSPFVYDPNYGL